MNRFDNAYNDDLTLIQEWHNLLDIPQETTPLRELLQNITTECCRKNPKFSKADFYKGTSIERRSFNSWINPQSKPKKGHSQEPRKMCSRPSQDKLAEIANKDFIPSQYKDDFAAIDNPSRALEFIDKFVDSNFHRPKVIREFYNGKIPTFTARNDVKPTPILEVDRKLKSQLDKDLGLYEQAFSNAEWAHITIDKSLISNIMAFQLVFYLQLSYEQSLQLLRAYGHNWQTGNPKSDFLLEQLNNGCFNASKIVTRWRQDYRCKPAA